MCLSLSDDCSSSRLFMAGGFRIIQEDWQTVNSSLNQDDTLVKFLKTINEKSFDKGENQQK